MHLPSLILAERGDGLFQFIIGVIFVLIWIFGSITSAMQQAKKRRQTSDPAPDFGEGSIFDSTPAQPTPRQQSQPASRDENLRIQLPDGRVVVLGENPRIDPGQSQRTSSARNPAQQKGTRPQVNRAPANRPRPSPARSQQGPRKVPQPAQAQRIATPAYNAHSLHDRAFPEEIRRRTTDAEQREIDIASTPGERPRKHMSMYAELLRTGGARQALILSEILGKPVGMRDPNTPGT